MAPTVFRYSPVRTYRQLAHTSPMTVRTSKAEIPSRTSASSARFVPRDVGAVSCRSTTKICAPNTSSSAVMITVAFRSRTPCRSLSPRHTRAFATGSTKNTKHVSEFDATGQFKSHTAPTTTKEAAPPPPPSSPLAPTDQPFPAPYVHSPATPTQPSSITNWVLASPRRTDMLLKIGDWLGYGSPKQVAARRSKIIYDVCSEVALGKERVFWYDTLSLPPSFQSWFTITNLHVWLVTARLRALPAPHGRPFIQALIDHFFFDVEDRLRAVLGKKAPERLVTRHMKILREQWGGLGLACDHALITGDRDMASAMWRNLLGARGARGIACSDDVEPASPVEAVPLVSNNPSFQRRLKPEDPASGGVSDFEGPAIDKYVLYPQLMLVLVGYLRRELVRLDHVSDAVILGGEGRGMRESVFGPQDGSGNVSRRPDAVTELREAFQFGQVKDAARKIGAEIGF